MNKLPGWIAVCAFLVLAVNLLFLDFVLLDAKRPASSLPQEEKLSEAAQKDECGPSCQSFIEERIAEAIATVSASIKKIGVSQKAVAIPSPSSSSGERSRTAIKVTSYLSLGTGGSIQKSDWTRVDGSEFTFDLRDYSSDAKVYWEGNLRSQYTNSRCYARLFDKTNSRAVDYSEQSTDKTENQYLTSQELTIWFGKLKYQLEIKSLNNVTCYLDSPRLVVKY